MQQRFACPRCGGEAITAQDGYGPTATWCFDCSWDGEDPPMWEPLPPEVQVANRKHDAEARQVVAWAEGRLSTTLEGS